ncbi:MAG: AAA family ATPase, partial [Candidatus Omnitrophica bacterium]|nr:AAA family ATPase [Candidatus Omnitrophota bacterium]
MFLKGLKLANFRNFTNLDIKFTKITLLLGDNAQGKSNLLEAIYFLATTKSLKADPDSQLIKQNEDFCRVEGEISDQELELSIKGEDGEEMKLEIAMQKRPEEEGGGLNKRLKVNGVPRRTLDYIGHLIAIHFSPEDINLVAGPPALRRWHLDLILAQVDKEYKRAITDYVAIISSRNKLLKRIKEGQASLDQLQFWTEKMLEHGKIVADKRTVFFEFINNHTDSRVGQFTFCYH